MLRKGRVAVKVAGRDTGVCIVLQKKGNNAIVVGPEVREREVSISHIEPLPETLDADQKKKDLFEKLEEIQKKVDESVPDFITLTAVKARMRR